MRTSLLLILLITGSLYAQTPDLSGLEFCIDPGHGGSATGAISPKGITEKSINLTVARYLRDYVLAAGADKAILTRNSDVNLSLGDREGIANRANVDWFHSVHHNAPGSSSDHSTDFTMVLYSEIVSGPFRPGSEVMSAIMSAKLSNAVNLFNYGAVGDYTFYGTPRYLGVLNDLTMPGELSEAFFISANVEDARIRNPDYLKTEAEALYLSILQYYGSELPAYATVVGVVRDRLSRKPAISIELKDLTGGKETIVDNFGNGFFRLDSLAPGSHTIEFVSIYDSITADYMLQSGTIRFVNLSMDADVYTPPGTPDPPVLLSVLRNGGEVVIRWSEPASDVRGYRFYHSFEGDSWTRDYDESTLPAGTTEHIIPFLPPETDIYFRLKAVSTESSIILSEPSDAYGIRLSDSQSPVLIVDGFDAQNSWRQSYHQFTLLHGLSLSAEGNNFETAANEAILTGAVALADYTTIVWVLGDESGETESFSSGEQELLKSFLENGGNLFVSGSEIGSDLTESGNESDSLFYADYLKAGYAGKYSGASEVTGQEGSIFAGMSFGFGDEALGSPYSVESPEAITLRSGSEALLSYAPGEEYAAIGYVGSFGGGTETGSLVYLSFPFETIHSRLHRDVIMYHVMHYFGRDANPVTEIPASILPKSIYMLPVHPNPFNPQTVISFELRSPARARLSIHDLLGRQLTLLVDASLNTGVYRFGWDGLDGGGHAVASGIYFARLEAGHQIMTRKMTLLR